MTVLPWLFALAFAAPAPSAFELVDVDLVEGRPINRFRPLELGERPARPVTWEVPPPPGVRYGLVPVGPHTESALAFAWDPDRAALWFDADGDRRLTGDERHEVKAGAALAVAASLSAPGGPPGSPGAVRRTLLFRPGLLGGGPRYTVRGGMSGALDLGGRPVRAMLTDGNADGCFDAAGTDRVWVDLDGDGRFDPVSEQFPLGTPIAAGATSYTVASDPWARSVRAHERDARLGRVRLSLGDRPRAGRVVGLVANLVSETGELVTVQKVDDPAEAPVGRYRVAALAVQMADDSGRVWSYTFGGDRRSTITVEPGAEAREDLLRGLAFEVTAAVDGGARPGDAVDVTPHLRLASGLYLSNCTTRRGENAREQERSAGIVLKSPGGAPLDRAVSGFL